MHSEHESACDHIGNERASAVADERKSQSGNRRQPDIHPDVDEYLKGPHGNDSADKEAGEQVRGCHRPVNQLIKQ